MHTVWYYPKYDQVYVFKRFNGKQSNFVLFQDMNCPYTLNMGTDHLISRLLEGWIYIGEFD